MYRTGAITGDRVWKMPLCALWHYYMHNVRSILGGGLLKVIRIILSYFPDYTNVDLSNTPVMAKEVLRAELEGNENLQVYVESLDVLFRSVTQTCIKVQIGLLRCKK